VSIEILQPETFEAERHFYPRTLNAQIHPLVRSFMRMSVARIVARFCHLHPNVSPDALESLLRTPPKFFHWSGSDVFNASAEDGVKQKLIIETNSCPSGQKSFPNLSDDQEEGGYWRLIEKTFLPLVAKAIRKAKGQGILAMIYDKNIMESSGYGQVLATLTQKPVYLIPCMKNDPEAFLTVRDRHLFAKLPEGELPIVCAFRYVTQKPWTRLPFNLKTPVLNPIVCCLAGGRNKTVAAKAYQQFNSEHQKAGLEINVPETFTNVRKAAIPLLVERFGGKAVIKVPYLNAGQGIYTVVNESELEAFMNLEHNYEGFVVQQLVGNLRWSSRSQHGRVYNIGLVPDKKALIYAFDIRMMISWQGASYRPVAMYARRARTPMTVELKSSESSWSVLGTNLSKQVGENEWVTEPTRLLMFDEKDFNRLGLGLDDLIECFMQSVFANRAIDDLAKKLVKRGGGFNVELYRSLNDDAALLDEIYVS